MIDGGKYSLGGIEFAAGDSLAAVLDTVKELPHSSIQKLVAAYHIKVGAGTSSFDVLLTVMGEIQNEWYVAYKGGIPVAVEKNQEVRKEKTGAAKAKPAAAEKTVRALTIMKVATGKTDEIKALKGQAEQVVRVLKTLGKADVKQVGEGLVALGEEFKTKQDPTRVASFYFTQLQKKGLLTEA